MRRDPRAYLWNARQAAERIVGFVAGRTRQEYEGDVLLRSAVERQFEIAGEALNQLRAADAALAAEVPDLPRIVAFRNLLIHGYATIDDGLVWEIATERVQPLVATLNRLLGRTPAS